MVSRVQYSSPSRTSFTYQTCVAFWTHLFTFCSLKLKHLYPYCTAFVYKSPLCEVHLQCAETEQLHTIITLKSNYSIILPVQICVIWSILHNPLLNCLLIPAQYTYRNRTMTTEVLQ
jgi:hypothetical protein